MPNRLLEISERLYVFSCCKSYMGDTIDQLKDRYPEASILIHNFGDKESSQVASSLSNYDVNVMDYPQKYKGFPLLPMEVIHHFLKTSESWLLLGQQHVLLMHCEQGGWPILAYMLAAFMTYNNNYSGQGRTLDVVYKQAARELLQFFPRLNPLPSQLRYLQYVSRNVGVKWPLQDKALTLKCVVFQFIPDFDGNGGCRPIFRIYGQDPLHPGDKTPKLLFSTPKMNTDFGYYKQEELELINYDINCHVQGDIVLECINLYADLTSEKMMFRTMFNTAFMGSNFVVLNRDEIDTLWDAKDTFHNDFRAKLIFSDLDATAFKPPAELTCLYEWLGPKRDVILNVSHQIATPDIVQETSATGSSQSVQSINLYNVAPDLNKQKLSDVVKNKLQPKSVLSPHSPSVLSSPPPPPPLLKGKILMKGGPTPPPPPPPPPPRPPTLKVMGHNLSTTQFSKNPGSTKLKAYHWSKLKKRVNGTLWAEAQNPGEALKVPEINMTELASLFSTSEPRAELKREYKGKIELRRAFNCEIILSNIRIPINELMESVLALDDSALDVVQVDNLIKICPTKEEMNIIMEYRGDRNELGKCEQFFMELMRVPRAESKLRVFSFKLQFNALVSELWLRLNIINLSAKQIMGSAKLKAVMQTILSLGNALNQGTRRGDAIGFRLESLLKLTDIRSNNQRTSLMHYLCKVLADKQPELLNFSKDLGSLVHASKLLVKSLADDMLAITTGLRNFMSEKRFAKKEGPVSKRFPKIQLKYLAEEIQAISKGLEKVGEELSMAENDGPVSEKFRKALKEFLRSAEGEVRSLASLYSVVGKNVDSLIRYFGEDPVHCPYEQVVSTLLKFVIMFNQANEENANQLKAEKKKAKWEASKQEKLKLIRIKSQDMSELESLFPASNTSAEQGDAKLKSWAAIANKPEKVLLIDHRRAYNCEVMLTKVKLPLNELMDYVLALEDSGLDPDQVKNFIKFCPTQEEMETLKGYKGEKDKLGKCEQFFLELMKVPRTESKLRVFSFKMQFNAQVSDLTKNLYIVNSVVEQTRSSGKLKRVMQTILSLGNALNQGTARGSAVGVRLDSLLKLTDIRGNNNRMTLMHYLCKVLADKIPEVLDFSKDLNSLEPAAKIQLKYLAEEMQVISKGLEKVSEELSMAENDGPVSENFRKVLKEFLHSAEGEVRSLASLYSVGGKNVDSLILYFGEDPVRCPYEQVVSTLLKFVRMFNQANEENVKQIEAEKKKTEREA